MRELELDFELEMELELELEIALELDMELTLEQALELVSLPRVLISLTTLPCPSSTAKLIVVSAWAGQVKKIDGLVPAVVARCGISRSTAGFDGE